MRRLALLTFAVLSACGSPSGSSSGPERVAIPVADARGHARTPGGKELPPASLPAKESPFPAVAQSKLPNGLGLDVVTSKALPIVQVRLVVRAGTGFAGPGVGDLTAAMLKDGGTRAMTSAELMRRIETLGANLSVRADFDATVLSMAVTKDVLPEALSLLSQVVREPRFDDGELRKRKARDIDEAESVARSSGSWTGTWLLFREVFSTSHPYGSVGALPSQIARVDGSAIRDFHRRFYVPKASTLVLAGDIDQAGARALADNSFGTWTGGDPPKVDIAPPKPAEKTRIFVAHRAKSVQSDVFVAFLAPDRRDPKWAHVRVANHVLGGGVASRLFQDVREQRSLAYRTGAQIHELAHGQQPLVLVCGTETAKTAQAVTGLLENVAKMTTAPPTDDEVKSARRYLSDIFAIRMETIGSIADMIVTLETFGLPLEYYDSYRKEIRATEASVLAPTARALYGGKPLVVVSGDSDVIAPELTRFGEVTVVDPEKEFKTLRTVPPQP